MAIGSIFALGYGLFLGALLGLFSGMLQGILLGLLSGVAMALFFESMIYLDSKLNIIY
jgi:hypothetical protein